MTMDMRLGIQKSVPTGLISEAVTVRLKRQTVGRTWSAPAERERRRRLPPQSKTRWRAGDKVVERCDDNSPAIHGWVSRQTKVKVPRGTTEKLVAVRNGGHPQGSFVPGGTWNIPEP